jgi:osmotically inducible protein OsmC
MTQGAPTQAAPTTEAVYTASATSTGDGRNGHVRTSDGILEADLATPAEMGGRGGATNPEQLFAAGFSACFHSALKAVASQHGVSTKDSAVTADVGIAPREDGGFGLSVTLHVELTGVTEEQAKAVVDAADAVCPYTHATRGNIPVTFEIDIV